MRIATIVFIVCELLIGCVSRQTHGLNPSFADKVAMSGKIHLVGWAKLHGEFEIYSDRESLEHELKFPNCISGIFGDQYENDYSKYDGKRVSIVGELYQYSELPDEERPVVPRKTLSGAVVSNWCFGRNVILITGIQLVP